MAGAAGLDVGEGFGAFEDVLECFEEAVAGYFGGEAACTGEGFDDAVRCLDGALAKFRRIEDVMLIVRVLGEKKGDILPCFPKKALESQISKCSRSIAVEHLRSALNLLPVHPS